MNYHQIINVILFRKSIIIKITGLSFVLIFLILFFVYPVSYEAPITVLPPEKNSQMGGLSSLLGANMDISNFITGGINGGSSQLFAEILKSRSAAEYVIKKHNLIAFYGSDDMFEAVKKLSSNLNIEISKEGLLKLDVNVSTHLFPIFTDERRNVRQLSADISNSFIEALDLINRNKLTSKAKQAREYIEGQIIITKGLLDSVETQLMVFQKSNKTFSLPDQVKSAIEAAAKIKAEIVTTEIELGMVQSNLKEDNRTLITLKSKLEQLREQYNKMELGSQDYLVSFKEVPQLGKELASLLREVKIQNEVYLLLQQQYYKEKIQENKDISTIDILDAAIPPQKPASPRIIFSTVLGGVFVFAFICMVFIYSEQKKLKINV
ncbi:MAG: Wzz/FepE/Etk N-terminal domain-containing protein [Ignavibacteriaceae bacterium]|nr:Wzz/FepE/Etk N-terminal domain-containing protein [Ignavibacteriaceae bacterium]